MIRRSTIIASAAILLSVLVHVLGLTVTSGGLPQAPTESVSGDVVTVNDTFENMADAVSTPAPREPAPVPEPPVQSAAEPDYADAPTSEALVASANPQHSLSPDTGSATAVEPKAAGSPEPEETAAPEPETVEPSAGGMATADDAAVTPAVTPGTVAQAPRGDPDAGAKPAEPAASNPVPATPVAPVPAPDVRQRVAVLPAQSAPVPPVTPVPVPSAVPIPPQRDAVDPLETTFAPEPEEPATDSDLAVVTSPRPRLPQRRPSEVPEGLADGSTEFSALQYPPLMESPLTAYRRNRTDLTIRGNGGSQLSGLGFSDSRGTGNADVTNYAGRVLVHLNRAAPVPVSGRGFARVFIEINPDGTLAQVDIIDSSGSPAINRAARAQIQGAAPFPPPPQGASRRLSFVYRID